MVDQSGLQVVVFRLGKEEYGVDILSTMGIHRASGLRFSTEPGLLTGWLDIPGGEIPVVDLRARFGFPREFTPQTRVLTVEVEGKPLGLLVDGVVATISLARDEIEPPPVFLRDGSALVGIGKVAGRLIILLDPGRLLAADEAAEVWRPPQEKIEDKPARSRVRKGPSRKKDRSKEVVAK